MYFTALGGPFRGDGFFDNQLRLSWSNGKLDDSKDLTSSTLFPDLKKNNPSQKTLESVIANLNVRRNGNKRFAVDNALFGKPVTYAGLANADSMRIMEALTLVYGLRLRQEMNKAGEDVETICLREVSAPKSLAEFPLALASAFPDSMRRALHIDELTELHGKYSGNTFENRSLPEAPVSAEQHERKFNRLLTLQELPVQLRLATVARLRLLVEPKLYASPNGAVAFTALSQEEKNAFALVILSELAARLRYKYTIPSPASLRHFNDVILGSTFTTDEAGERRLGIVYYLPGSDGQLLQTSTGFGQMPYAPHPPKQ